MNASNILQPEEGMQDQWGNDTIENWKSKFKLQTFVQLKIKRKKNFNSNVFNSVISKIIKITGER
jgi:hypothetical protein